MEYFKNSLLGQHILSVIIEQCEKNNGKITKNEIIKYLLNNTNYGFATINLMVGTIQHAIKFKKITILDFNEDTKVFFLAKKPTNIAPSFSGVVNMQITLKEEIFYEPFANFLVNTLKECTKAIALGGSQFKDKWGTPDVLGIYKFPEIAPIRPFPEIVTAEIKLDETQIITAFGQACAYKLFSHKVYLVIPSSTPEEDIARTESLCMKFGIGLITFDKDNPENPRFTIRTRAIKHEPDYSFVNNYLQKLTNEQQIRLFG